MEKKQGSRASSLSFKIGFAVSHMQLPPGISPKFPYLVLGFQDYQHTLKLFSLQLLAVFWARIIFPGSFSAVGQAAKGLTVTAGDAGLGTVIWQVPKSPRVHPPLCSIPETLKCQDSLGIWILCPDLPVF